MEEKKIQVVTFGIADEVFGLYIIEVKEIIRTREIVWVPNSPDFIEGIINLRGDVIPIISLRKIFKIKPKEKNLKTRIIICDLQGIIIGIEVDEVYKVISVAKDQLKKMPAVFSKIVDQNLVEGVIKTDDKLVIFLKILDVLTEDQKQRLALL